MTEGENTGCAGRMYLGQDKGDLRLLAHLRVTNGVVNDIDIMWLVNVLEWYTCHVLNWHTQVMRQ